MYLVIFGVGIGFIGLTLVFGGVFEFEGIGHALSPKIVALFMVVMGGLGLLLTPRMEYFVGGRSIVAAISVAGGLVVAAAVCRFVLIPMRNAENTSAFNIQDTIGVQAEVISIIPQGGYGKIRYSISGSVVTSPAKSEDGNQIKRGEHVEIIYVEKNTYFVRSQPAVPVT